MIDLKYTFYFLFLISIVGSIAITTVYLKEKNDNKKALLYFATFFWLTTLNLLLKDFVWLINIIAILSSQLLVVAFYSRYSRPCQMYMYYAFAIQMLFSILNGLIFKKFTAESTWILMGVNCLWATIVIIRHANFKNSGEKYSITALTYASVLSLIYFPVAINLIEDKTQYWYQVIASNSLMLLLLFCAILLSYLYDQINNIYLTSIKDPMTGLFNRRYFNEQSLVLLSHLKRENREGFFIMCDIDKFKNINDTYGHDVGDSVIISFADTLKSIVRKEDLLARFGGEEFVIMLPEIQQSDAIKLAERLRTETEKLIINRLKFTASFGVAEINLNLKNLDKAIKNADEALYLAKNNGRNRVCVYSN